MISGVDKVMLGVTSEFMTRHCDPFRMASCHSDFQMNSIAVLQMYEKW